MFNLVPPSPQNSYAFRFRPLSHDRPHPAQRLRSRQLLVRPRLPAHVQDDDVLRGRRLPDDIDHVHLRNVGVLCVGECSTDVATADQELVDDDDTARHATIHLPLK
jgi:hypothetical protein